MANSNDRFPCRDLRVHILGENGTGTKRNTWLLWMQSAKPVIARRAARQAGLPLSYTPTSDIAGYMMGAWPAYELPARPFAGADMLIRALDGDAGAGEKSATWLLVCESARGCTAETAAQRVSRWAKAVEAREQNPLYEAEDDGSLRLLPARILMMPREWNIRDAASVWLPDREDEACFNWPKKRLEEAYRAQKGGVA